MLLEYEKIISDIINIERGASKEIASIEYSGGGRICRLEFYGEIEKDDDVPDTVPKEWK